jgi:hypothetical protein
MVHKSITEIWNDQIYPEILLYLEDLNWTFIITFIIVLYGIKHTTHYEWFNHYGNINHKVKRFKTWIVGIVIGCYFMFFRWLGPDGFHSEYVAQYLRSLIIAITFSGLLIDWPIRLIEGRRLKDKDKDE